MNVLDLFAGIGGFSLGLERAGGFKTVAFCEIDKNAQLVLQKNWKNVPIFEDVSSLTKDALDAKGISVDVITGGFPCQDISLAGKGAGLEGERSGLWFQFHRLIKEIRPKYAIIENVSALRSRGLDRVLRSLSEIGYDAEWHCVPASAVGAPHRRDRIWIVAYPRYGNRRNIRPVEAGKDTQVKWTTDTNSVGRSSYEPENVAHPSSARSETWIPTQGHRKKGNSEISDHLGDRLNGRQGSDYWTVEPNVGRVAHGVPNRSHRLKQLGNAVVPQLTQIIGEAILDFERDRSNPC
jgi:DNA (cytosine-5)-methyltransferase 1